MSEAAPGVSVSSLDTDEWDPDPDIGGSAHILFEEGDVVAGLWRSGPDEELLPVEADIPARETILVLDGSVRFGVAGSEPLVLRAGQMVSLPAGRVCGIPRPARRCSGSTPEAA